MGDGAGAEIDHAGLCENTLMRSGDFIAIVDAGNKN